MQAASSVEWQLGSYPLRGCRCSAPPSPGLRSLLSSRRLVSPGASSYTLATELSPGRGQSLAPRLHKTQGSSHASPRAPESSPLRLPPVSSIHFPRRQPTRCCCRRRRRRRKLTVLVSQGGREMGERGRWKGFALVGEAGDAVNTSELTTEDTVGPRRYCAVHTQSVTQYITDG